MEKETFRIGQHEFSFDKTQTIIEVKDNYIINIKIRGNEELFDKSSENDEFEFGWGLYPPEFYIREVNLGHKKQIQINDDNLDDYDVALYFIEHNDVYITMSLNTNWLEISGEVDMCGTFYPIIIKVKL